MRFYPRGSLRDVLDLALEDPEFALSLATKLRMARDVAAGMEYLHTRRHQMVGKGGAVNSKDNPPNPP